MGETGKPEHIIKMFLTGTGAEGEAATNSQAKGPCPDGTLESIQCTEEAISS